MTAPAPFATFDFQSDLDVLPIVDAASRHIASTAGLDDDSVHWITLGTREAVVNAIRHGNGFDVEKRVFVEFSVGGDPGRPGVTVHVRDQGCGFSPSAVPDPIAPDNLEGTSGRGILMMRAFLDDVTFREAPGGGTEVVLVKRAPLPPTAG